jgi:hypothetical protein
VVTLACCAIVQKGSWSKDARLAAYENSIRSCYLQYPRLLYIVMNDTVYVGSWKRVDLAPARHFFHLENKRAFRSGPFVQGTLIHPPMFQGRLGTHFRHGFLVPLKQQGKVEVTNCPCFLHLGKFVFSREDSVGSGCTNDGAPRPTEHGLGGGDRGGRCLQE